MLNTTKTTLLTYSQIESAVKRLAGRIDEDYEDEDPLLLCVLNGAFMFFSDLMRRLSIKHQVDFLKVRSYGNGETAEEAEWVLRPDPDVIGRHVLVVDDIIDTGHTAKFISTSLRMNKAKSVSFCVLLSKMANRRYDIFCPYVGFDIDDHFVYGYGMDSEGRDRHLLEICYGHGLQDKPTR